MIFFRLRQEITQLVYYILNVKLDVFFPFSLVMYGYLKIHNSLRTLRVDVAELFGLPCCLYILYYSL